MGTTNGDAMSMIDKQRIAVVEVLLGMGFHFRDGAWVVPQHFGVDLTAAADRLHAVLVERADEIGGCPDGSGEDAELRTIADAIEAYEVKRVARWDGAQR
jgi:hypothetical protein